MRDLHSHYLPGVDDGSKSVEETKLMLANANENGVTDIVFTPHYIDGSRYTSTYEENMEIFLPLKEYAKEKYNINLFLGNEVFYSREILNLLKSKKITTINNSRYLLIEIPLNTKISNVKSLFIELINEGIIPILAHPERYTPYYDDIEFFVSLKKMGVLMQINIPSLAGIYGRKAKHMALKLLKNDLISFVGTDYHHIDENKNNCLNKALKKLKKMVGEDEFIEITMNNFARVVMNDDIN